MLIQLQFTHAKHVWVTAAVGSNIMACTDDGNVHCINVIASRVKQLGDAMFKWKRSSANQMKLVCSSSGSAFNIDN